MNAISTSHVLQDLARFDDSILAKLQFAYEQVISSISDKSVIPYYPNLYPIPFMIVKTYKVGYYSSKVLFYSLTYPDAKDFHKFAIYINKSLIENFPNYLHGVIGHEIAHVIASKGKVEMTKEDLAIILKHNRLAYIKEKEKSAENVYPKFAEPIQTKIREWNIQSTRKDIEDLVAIGAQLVNHEYFDKIIFGDKLDDYRQFIKFNLSKINE